MLEFVRSNENNTWFQTSRLIEKLSVLRFIIIPDAERERKNKLSFARKRIIVAPLEGLPAFPAEVKISWFSEGPVGFIQKLPVH